MGAPLVRPHRGAQRQQRALPLGAGRAVQARPLAGSLAVYRAARHGAGPAAGGLALCRKAALAERRGSGASRAAEAHAAAAATVGSPCPVLNTCLLSQPCLEALPTGHICAALAAPGAAQVRLHVLPCAAAGRAGPRRALLRLLLLLLQGRWQVGWRIQRIHCICPVRHQSERRRLVLF